MRRFTTSLGIACLIFAIALPVAAETEVEGRTRGGAHYKFVVPDAWNGDLVIWNHGFSLSPIGPVDDIGLLADLQLLDGYAVAASSYSQVGWALFKTKRDLRKMYQAFVREFGAPNRVIVTGASLGGIVTAQAIEAGGIGNVVGALPICGALAGSRNWDGALDARLVYDTICADIPEAAIPGGARGLPKNSGWTPQQVGDAVNACMGVDLRPGQRSQAQKRNLKKFKKVTKLPQNFIQVVMGYVTFGLSDLSYDRGKMRGKMGLSNANVDYGDAGINANIERVEALQKPERRLQKNYTPNGKVGDVKILSIHTDKDGLVLVENESEYAKVVPPENLTIAVARERVPSHCGFTLAEGVGAWFSLVDWIDTGIQPSSADVQEYCEGFTGLFPGPCRYDPNFQIPDLDRRIRPRQPEADE